MMTSALWEPGTSEERGFPWTRSTGPAGDEKELLSKSRSKLQVEIFTII